MVHLHKTVSIAATPGEVWAVLGDLAATTEWLPGMAAAHMDGSTRICTMQDGSVIREEISDYSPERRAYTYRHVEVPMPVRDSSGTFTVDADGDRALVTLEADFEALDPAAEPELERMFGGSLEQALESLRRRVEEGLTWEAA
jgi:uncharacterized protein YndB with AHSA1/START domain